MNFIRFGAVTLALVAIVLVPTAGARAASVEEMLAQIQTLMTQIQTLQEQLSTIKGEVKAVIKEGLAEGMSDEDIQKLQELLATDPTIYPEGKVTGYFGPLTKEAVKRFQARHELEVTGIVDADTHALLLEYLSEGFGSKIPAGLLRAPGIAKKVELRYELKCEGRGNTEMGPLCKKLKVKYELEDDEDSDEDADSREDEDSDDENDDEFDIEVEIEDDTTTVSFTYEDEDYSVEVEGTDKNDILDAAADAIDENDDAGDLDEDLSDAIEEALTNAVDEAEDDEDGSNEDEDEDEDD